MLVGLSGLKSTDIGPRRNGERFSGQNKASLSFSIPNGDNTVADTKVNHCERIQLKKLLSMVEGVSQLGAAFKGIKRESG